MTEPAAAAMLVAMGCVWFKTFAELQPSAQSPGSPSLKIKERHPSAIATNPALARLGLGV